MDRFTALEKQPVVFVHRYKDSRATDAATITSDLKANGVLAPDIDGLDIAVNADQVRYFHPISEDAAKDIATITGIQLTRYVEGFEGRVGTNHFEIWLSP